MKKRTDIIANIDWFTVALYLALIIIGWLNIYAAEYAPEHSSIIDISQRYGKQFIWILIALVLGFMILVIDSKFFPYFAYPLYALVIVLLIGVLFLGIEVNNSQSWYAIGSYRIQPAELAKFATALAIAKYLSHYQVNLNNFRSIIISLAIIFIPAGLIILQPDAGTALVFLSFMIVLYREGLPHFFLVILLLLPGLFIASLLYDKIHVLAGITAIAIIVYGILKKDKKGMLISVLLLGFIGGVSWLINILAHLNFSAYQVLLSTAFISALIFMFIAIFQYNRKILIILAFFVGSVAYTFSVNYMFNNVLQKHQQERINIALGIKSDPLGVGYNINQSKIAIGSGGISGKGFLKGTQTKFNFVPEQSTDFIFCTVGEEWGFIGSSILVILFVLLFVKIVTIAERQRSVFARIYGYAVLSILFFHFAINIGMTIGLFPVIGIPLPFFSYGGSSLWGFTILLFILINLDTRRYALMA